MIPVSELFLPPLPTSLCEVLGLAEAPPLRRVDLAELQAEVEGGRLVPEQFLTPDEQTAYAGLTFPKRRWEWLGGRLAAKATALAWEGLSLNATSLAWWQVSNAPDGRPNLRRLSNLQASPALELSISHSHGVAAALVTDRLCGLDLQKFTDTVVRVRERFCTEVEGRLLREIDARDQEVRLTMLWAAKEALRKACGGEPLIGFLAMRLVGLEKFGEQNWCFRLAVAGAGEYPVAVCILDNFAGAMSLL